MAKTCVKQAASEASCAWSGWREVLCLLMVAATTQQRTTTKQPRDKIPKLVEPRETYLHIRVRDGLDFGALRVLLEVEQLAASAHMRAERARRRDGSGGGSVRDAGRSGWTTAVFHRPRVSGVVLAPITAATVAVALDALDDYFAAHHAVG